MNASPNANAEQTRHKREANMHETQNPHAFLARAKRMRILSHTFCARVKRKRFIPCCWSVLYMYTYFQSALVHFEEYIVHNMYVHVYNIYMYVHVHYYYIFYSKGSRLRVHVVQLPAIPNSNRQHIEYLESNGLRYEAFKYRNGSDGTPHMVCFCCYIYMYQGRKAALYRLSD